MSDGGRERPGSRVERVGYCDSIGWTIMYSTPEGACMVTLDPDGLADQLESVRQLYPLGVAAIEALGRALRSGRPIE